MTIIEMLVALAILASAGVALVQLVGLIARQRHFRQQRVAALTEIANEAERLALAKWDEVTPEKLSGWQPSAELSAAVPQAKCRALVFEEAGSPISRRIQLLVSWPNAAGQEMEPAALTLWKFPPEAQP